MNIVEKFIDDRSLEELITTNVNHLGLAKNPWEFTRGARTQQCYNNDQGVTEVKEIYSYTWSPDNRRIVSIDDRIIEWYKSDSSLLHAEDTTPIMDLNTLEEINESMFKRQIRYLKTAAENLAVIALSAPEPYKTQYSTISQNVLTIMQHYQVEIALYEAHGTIDFENKVVADYVYAGSDPELLNIKSLLDTITRAPDAEFPNGLTARTSILYQLTGVIP